MKFYTKTEVTMPKKSTHHRYVLVKDGCHLQPIGWGGENPIYVSVSLDAIHKVKVELQERFPLSKFSIRHLTPLTKKLLEKQHSYLTHSTRLKLPKLSLRIYLIRPLGTKL